MTRKIYFMGIKGVGMTTLAILAKEAGFIVEGSDVEDEFITDKELKNAGITVKVGFSEENPKAFFDTSPVSECLFIATGAHNGFENPEAIWAQEKGIKTISHGEALGLFMSGKPFDRQDIEGVSVSGSHGKTSISGMISFLLSKIGQDPSFAVGTGEIVGLGAAGHCGKGKYFVAEADEYMASKQNRVPRFLYQNPKYLIINNIDFDHPDFYRDIEAVKNAFLEFADELNEGSTLIANGDDENIQSIISLKKDLKNITYGVKQSNEFVISDFKQEGLGSKFDVSRNGTLLGSFELSIPGYHNAKNSLSAIALLMELGISVADIQRVLKEFKGVERRLQEIGKMTDGTIVFDDYGHHPEEIRKTLEALKGAYPDRKLRVVFQAHTFERTKALMNEFVASFTGVFELIILPTFVSARNVEAKDTHEDQEFVEKVRMLLPNVKLIEQASDVVKYLNENHVESSLVLTIGAGDVYKIANELVKK